MKIAIITGGSRGVGKSIALHTAKRGNGVILTYNSKKEEADAVVSEIQNNGGRAAALQMDVTQTSSFDAFVSQVVNVLEKEWEQKTFDYLVNNAGIAQRTLIKDTTEKEFDNLVRVNFKGPFFLTQKLISVMVDGGQILNISSGLTRFTHPGVATYAATKAAMEVLTIYQAKEYAARKIRVNIVAPGALDTEFGGGKNDDAKKLIGNATALGRVGQAEDIGLFIASLLCEDSRWVNAQRIEVSGGMYI